MSRSILHNRGAELGDGHWIHIVPKGELPNGAAGIVQVLDDKALDSILANLKSDENRLGNRWPGLYGGKEHWIYEADQDSGALAWFTKFEKRNDGIWASADGLTGSGRDAIRNKEYKFTSFSADRDDLEPLGGNRYRVLKIDTVGFTNAANGKELLTPINNRSLAAVANGKAPARLDAADWASKELLRQMGQLDPRMGVSGNLALIKNRQPRLVKISNREVGFEYLAGVEGLAHTAYMKAVDGEPGLVQTNDPRYRKDGNSRTEFLQAAYEMRRQYPDAGYEGRWEKLKEEQPDLFWRFVASFEPETETPATTFSSAQAEQDKAFTSERKQAALERTYQSGYPRLS